MTRHLAILLLALAVNTASAKPDSGNNDTTAELKPLIQWNFDDSKEPGPRTPSYPAFSTTNTAALSETSGHVALLNGQTDPLAIDLKFGLNDEITLEAWVRVKSLSDGSYVYVLGKGRTASSKKNQNYGLRIVGAKGQVKLNFLFASAASPTQPNGWHRWTSTETFPADSWHHIAITYQFGKAKSIKGYIDGKPATGTWDMDGATDRAPVQDNDHLILGTGNGDGSKGRPGNRFIGWMDNVAIWKTALPAETLATRYQHVPPPPVVAKKVLTPGQVLIHICEEGIPDTARAWPAEPALPTETYTERAFAFFDQPIRYISTGVRGERTNPHLMRAAALVKLPKGTHRLLLRARGGSRLYINDQLILTTPFNTLSSSAHGRIASQAKYLDLGPDFRFAPPGNSENTCEFTSDGGEHFIIMETLVGGTMGKSWRRAELGETVVAWSPQGSQSWQLLSPSGETLPYTDNGWENYAAERRTHYAQVNAAAREFLRKAAAPFWEQRRKAATQWLANSPAIPVPTAPTELPTLNPIDSFLNAKIARFAQATKANGKRSIDFFKDVQPILEAKCYDCHQGGKAKGDLRLDELAAALKGGESDGPAILPGHASNSPLIARVTTTDEDELMPPKGKPLTEQEIATLTTWINEGADWPELRVDTVTLTPLTDDLAFLRRAYLDTVGVPPSLEEIAAFQAKPDRKALVDLLLTDPRWADHWTSYWQDVLAENPNILNPTLNNSGPFRWFIHESMLDNKPIDLFVTELLRMEGSDRYGGPAGFAVASQNDVPMAEKGMIVSSAFLGVEMKCARCHDAPAHKSLQEELFQIAAMLKQDTIELPKTSSVPMDRFHETGRKPLIQITLQPGAKVTPKWPFAEFCDEATAAHLSQDPTNPRDALAALITAPQNQRFAQVMANRIWARFMGHGIVSNVADWEKAKATHPELLAWLGREFVRSGYDMKQVARLIINSHAYQRAIDPSLRGPSPLFTAPAPRRLTAEQIVDSLFATTGKPFQTEEACLDIDGGRDLKNSISLGHPSRSWMLTSTSNERDRPSLALPRIQAVGDLLEAFGWRGARQDPTSSRSSEPNILQPAILSNGIAATWLTVLSDDHGVTRLAIEATSPEQLIDTLFLKLLTRQPSAQEKQTHLSYLSQGFTARLINPPQDTQAPTKRTRTKYVTWTNHLDPEATLVRQQEEAAARRGDPPTQRLAEDWRLRLEDSLWSILNAPEWVFAP
jgi:hypothetical protein